jgi:hypothetical protein
VRESITIVSGTLMSLPRGLKSLGKYERDVLDELTVTPPCYKTICRDIIEYDNETPSILNISVTSAQLINPYFS